MLINIIKAKKIIDTQIQVALRECCPLSFASTISSHEKYNSLIDKILDDATAYCKKDLALKDILLSVLQAYTSFKATLHYRIPILLINS